MYERMITMGLYSKAKAEEDARKLDEFADIAENYLIYEDMSPEEKAKQIKILRKAAKQLRKGKYEKVYDRSGYIEDMEARRSLPVDED